MFNRKAVSPLIATLLLIAVALFFAGILYVWSSSFAITTTQQLENSTQDQTACAFSGVKLEDLSSDPNRCDFNSTYPEKLKFKLSNTGTSDLNKNFTILVDDGNAVVTLSYTPNLAKGTFKIVTCIQDVSGDCTVTDGNLSWLGSIKGVRVTPGDCPTRYDETTSCNNSS